MTFQKLFRCPFNPSTKPYNKTELTETPLEKSMFFSVIPLRPFFTPFPQFSRPFPLEFSSKSPIFHPAFFPTLIARTLFPLWIFRHDYSSGRLWSIFQKHFCKDADSKKISGIFLKYAQAPGCSPDGWKVVTISCTI